MFKHILYHPDPERVKLHTLEALFRVGGLREYGFEYVKDLYPLTDFVLGIEILEHFPAVKLLLRVQSPS